MNMQLRCLGCERLNGCVAIYEALNILIELQNRERVNMNDNAEHGGCIQPVEHERRLILRPKSHPRRQIQENILTSSAQLQAEVPAFEGEWGRGGMHCECVIDD